MHNLQRKKKLILYPDFVADQISQFFPSQKNSPLTTLKKGDDLEFTI